MKLGGLSILDDVYNEVYLYLKDKIEGRVFIKEREANSTGEDAVLVFQDATADQFQDGFFRVNIYVQDLDYKGSYYCNVNRCVEIERLAEGLVKSINEAKVEYKVNLSSAPQTVRVPDVDVHQHFVTIPIQFRRVTIQ